MGNTSSYGRSPLRWRFPKSWGVAPNHPSWGTPMYGTPRDMPGGWLRAVRAAWWKYHLGSVQGTCKENRETMFFFSMCCIYIYHTYIYIYMCVCSFERCWSSVEQKYCLNAWIMLIRYKDFVGHFHFHGPCDFPWGCEVPVRLASGVAIILATWVIFVQPITMGRSPTHMRIPTRHDTVWT